MRRPTAWGLVLAGALGCGTQAPPPPMTEEQERASEAEMKQIADQEARDLQAEEQNRRKPGEPDPDLEQ
jgi:hypothetical protein